MPSYRSYGDMLRRARENAGFDVVTMSRRLHIRPDILKAIEAADFDRMPARGYSRNMIRAYARQVGLDEREISEKYLDEVHLFETGVPRSSAYSDRGSQRSSRPLRISDAYGRDSGSRNRSQQIDDRSSRRIAASSLSFNERDFPTDRDRDPDRSIRFYSSPRSRSRNDEARSQEFPLSRRQRQPQSIRFDQDGASRKSISLPKSSNSYTNVYSDSQRSSGISVLNNINMPLLIIIAIAAIALIIVIVVLFNGGKQSVDEVPDIPISGLTDTSDPENTIDPIEPISAAPVSAEFTYEVESGAQSWIEIYENGNSTPVFAGVVNGPATESYTVTGTLTFFTANPTPIKISVDGEEVNLNQSSSKSGYYSYLVDFPAILAQWESEHNQTGNTSPSNGNTTVRNTSNTVSSNTNSNSQSSNRSTTNTSNSSNQNSNSANNGTTNR